MSNAKRRKLRSCGRWCIWASTLAIIALTVASMFTGFWIEIAYEYADDAQTMSRASIEINETRIWVDYHPRQRQPWRDLPDPGFRVSATSIDYSSAVIDSHWWTGIQRWWGGSITGTSRGWSVPLVYPAVLMLGWSLLLVWIRRKQWHRVGRCSDCGYSLEGLNGKVCPECGEKCGVNHG